MMKIEKRERGRKRRHHISDVVRVIFKLREIAGYLPILDLLSPSLNPSAIVSTCYVPPTRFTVMSVTTWTLDVPSRDKLIKAAIEGVCGYHSNAM